MSFGPWLARRAWRVISKHATTKELVFLKSFPSTKSYPECVCGILCYGPIEMSIMHVSTGYINIWFTTE